MVTMGAPINPWEAVSHQLGRVCCKSCNFFCGKCVYEKIVLLCNFFICGKCVYEKNCVVV